MTQEFFSNSEVENSAENTYKNHTKEQLLELIEETKCSESGLKRNVTTLKQKISKLESLIAELQQRTFEIEDKYLLTRNELFGKSSEKSPVTESDESDTPSTEGINGQEQVKAKKKRVLLPSERYPNAPLIERHITFESAVKCPCCDNAMTDSGMTEDSECLTVVPAQYMVVRQRRHKYRCGKCHGAIVTASFEPRITPKGAFSDRLAIDVSVSKYCDLIPIQRYTAMAGRLGISDLPPQSLIEATHNLANFVKSAYKLLKNEILTSRVLHADETPHRMLEGDDKENWYLWGFTNSTAAYFDIRDTRSGDVASELLKKSKCEFLVSDVFSGYAKAARVTNEYRQQHKLALIRNIYCNAHARRKFKEAAERFKNDAQYFIDRYRSIYFLESQTKNPEKPPDEILEIRSKMQSKFEEMKSKAIEAQSQYSNKSQIYAAMRYFLDNYEELTAFITNADLPIDNNLQERLLRNPVIGRKTWYGTHSKQGSETAAVLFSIMESCKLNKVNPRKYLEDLVLAMHSHKQPFTPHTYAIS